MISEFAFYFSGRRPLWRAFWVVWVLGTVVVLVGVIAAVLLGGWLLTLTGMLTSEEGVGVSIWQLFVILGLSAVVWWMASWVIVWRCAPNSAWKGWKYVARGLVLAQIAWLAIGAVQIGNKYIEMFS